MYGRRSNAGVNRRFSPYGDAERRRTNVQIQPEEPEFAGGGLKTETAAPLPESSAMFLDEQEFAPPDTFVEEDAVQLREIGTHVASQNFTSNAEIINVTPLLTSDIQALSVTELLAQNTSDSDVRNTLAGLAVMINRLIFENRYLMGELQALKTTGNRDAAGQLESLAFKKEAVEHQHFFPGGSGIPPVCLNDLMELFDQNANRRHESGMQTLRRFVKFLLEQAIPKRLHTKFTVRERGGYEHLTEVPMELTTCLKDICLEAMNLFDVHSKEEEERRTEVSENIFKYMKFALQELRRTPRKAKVAIPRD